MPEAILEKAKCRACGTDAREGSQFCYSCGEPMAGRSEAPIPRPGADEPTASGKSRRKNSVNLPSERPIVKPDIPLVADASSLSATKTRAFPKRVKRSASPLKERQVEWIEPENSFWRPFIAAILIGGIVALMLAAAWALQ